MDCHRFQALGTVVETKSANYAHYRTSLGNFENNAVAIGGESTEDFPENKKVEIFQGEKWVELDDFPFVTSSIFLYSTVNFRNEMYIFGKFDFTFKHNDNFDLLRWNGRRR